MPGSQGAGSTVRPSRFHRPQTSSIAKPGRPGDRSRLGRHRLADPGRVALAGAEYRPGDPGQLAGERHDDLVLVSTADEATQPLADQGLACRERRQSRPRPVDQERAQVSVAPLRDAEELWFAAGRRLPRYQAQPSREITTGSECLARADCGNQCGRVQRPEP